MRSSKVALVLGSLLTVASAGGCRTAAKEEATLSASAGGGAFRCNMRMSQPTKQHMIVRPQQHVAETYNGDQLQRVVKNLKIQNYSGETVQGLMGDMMSIPAMKNLVVDRLEIDLDAVRSLVVYGATSSSGEAVPYKLALYEFRGSGNVVLGRFGSLSNVEELLPFFCGKD